MKKIKKSFKKLPRIFMTILVIFGILLTYVSPITKVYANNGEYNVTITINVSNESDVTLVAKGPSGDLANNVEGDNLSGRRGSNTNDNIIGFEDDATGDPLGVSVTCSSDKLCTAIVTVPDGHGVRLSVGGDAPFRFKFNDNDYDSNNTQITSNATFEVVDYEPEEPFDGEAYLVWSCGEKICYHLFEGLSNEGSFVKASTIIATNDANETFDVHAREKFFAPKDLFLERKAEIDANSVDIEDLIGPDGIDYMPVGEPDSNNAYTSYGNRSFKITIYGDDYRGVKLADLNELTYYPSAWTDPLGRVESYDISGTTKDNPVDIETVLIEPTINIKALSAYNGFNISSIEALDVPEGAVRVTKDNDKYKFTFSSNFYDKVVFKVTSTNNETYYLRINRLTLGVENDQVIYRPSDNDVDVIATFYFDRNTSYSDYILTAKIEYKDGTTKVVNMENAKKLIIGLSDVLYTEEYDDQSAGGKGLKYGNYKYTFKDGEVKKVSKMYINVEYKGSTKSNYAGAYSGSGKGTVVTFREDNRNEEN